MECNLVEMGSRIAARRRRLGISQNFLAEKVDISRNHLSNIERGREKPSFDVLINLCNILRVTPDYLLMGTMHSHGVPQNLIDSLALCTAEDIALLEDIVHHMLIAQTEENSQLKIRLEQAEAQLRDRRIEIDKAGSLAEAALSLNGVFQAAEAAAQQYLENIERISGQQDAICRDMKEQAKQEAAQIRQEAEAYSQKAHAEADAYWKQIVAKAAKLLADQKALREMIQAAGEVWTDEK